MLAKGGWNRITPRGIARVWKLFESRSKAFFCDENELVMSMYGEEGEKDKEEGEGASCLCSKNNRFRGSHMLTE